jgi:hypothetical protein
VTIKRWDNTIFQPNVLPTVKSGSVNHIFFAGVYVHNDVRLILKLHMGTCDEIINVLSVN